MGSDVVDITTATTGIQRLGDTVVFVPGLTHSKVYTGSRHTINVANISFKYDSKIDDPGEHVSVSDKPLVSKGYQQLTSLSTSTALTVPTDARFALIQAESQSIRIRLDGTDPGPGTGILIAAGDSMWIPGNLSGVRLIEETASATGNVDYEGF